MEKYGPLTPWVIYGSNLVAAVWALRVAALGHALWEPKVEGFPRAPVRIAGVGAILLLAVIFAISRKRSEIEFWIPWALWIFVPLIVLFVADIFLRQWLIVECKPSEPIFGGIWLTKRAQAILRGAPEAYANKDLAKGATPPPSAAALYCSFSGPTRDKTRVLAARLNRRGNGRRSRRLLSLEYSGNYRRCVGRDFGHHVNWIVAAAIRGRASFRKDRRSVWFVTRENMRLGHL